MKAKTVEILEDLLRRYPALQECRTSIEDAFRVMRACYAGRGKLLICGNGGSAADAEHMVGELLKGFMNRRPLTPGDREKVLRATADSPAEGRYLAERLQSSLPAISLVSHSAFLTAFSNDVDAELAFAQQVYGYGRPGDVVIGLSTSGQSKNVYYAMRVAKAFGMKTIAFTGRSGGKLKEIADVSICVPAESTPIVQEYHLPVYHALCMMLEEEEVWCRSD